MKHFGIFGLITALFALSSCATAKYVSVEDDMNNEWVGRRHSEIVREFGAPDRETSDGKNGTILVYESITRSYRTDEDTHFGYFDPDYTTTISENRSYIHFFIEGNGVCYLVKTNHVKREGKGPTGVELFSYSTWGLGLAIPIILALFAFSG